MKSRLFTLLFSLAGLSANLAAEEITGEWDMTMEVNGQPRIATLTVSREADGSYTGQWGSSRLVDVTFDGETLAFARIRGRGDREVRQTFTGFLKDGKLEGVLSGQRGEVKAVGTRPQPKSPVLGYWNIRFEVQDRAIEAVLSVSNRQDGTLEAEWKEDSGQHTVTRVRYEEGDFTLDRTVRVGDREFDVTYVAKVEGDQMTGEMISPFGSVQAGGSRMGSAFVGTWDLAFTSERGPRSRMVKIYRDLTGRYEVFGQEIPVVFELQGEQITFQTERSLGGREFELSFKAELDGARLRGETTTARGSTPFAGERRVQPLALAVGTWELVRETDDGERRTSILKIKDATSGTYAFRDREVDLEDLTIHGDEVAFNVTLTFNDREIPLSFKGKVDTSTLKGDWTSPRGTRKIEGKRVPQAE